MESIVQYLVDHEAFACVLGALLLSELLPFMRGRAAPFNGIAQAVIALLIKRAKAKVEPKEQP